MRASRLGNPVGNGTTVLPFLDSMRNAFGCSRRSRNSIGKPADDVALVCVARFHHAIYVLDPSPIEFEDFSCNDVRPLSGHTVALRALCLVGYACMSGRMLSQHRSDSHSTGAADWDWVFLEVSGGRASAPSVLRGRLKYHSAEPRFASGSVSLCCGGSISSNGMNGAIAFATSIGGFQNRRFALHHRLCLARNR